MIELRCPKCGRVESLPESQAGQPVTCPACGNVSTAPPPVQPTVTPSKAPLAEKDVRMWGMLCHLAGLAGFVVFFFGFAIGPLIVWLIKGKEHPFIDAQGKEALNFQITVCIAMGVSFVLAFVFIGIFLWIALAIADLVFIILASIKANEGQSYRYPYAIRFIK